MKCSGHAQRRQTLILYILPNGLVTGPMISRDMPNYSEDCALVMIASEQYDELFYICNYDRPKDEAQVRLYICIDTNTVEYYYAPL